MLFSDREFHQVTVGVEPFASSRWQCTDRAQHIKAGAKSIDGWRGNITAPKNRYPVTIFVPVAVHR